MMPSWEISEDRLSTYLDDGGNYSVLYKDSMLGVVGGALVEVCKNVS